MANQLADKAPAPLCPACYILELKHYPVFLDLKDRPVLVVGAGKVALRKTRGLVEAGARITVIAPEWEPEFEELPVRLVRRRFRASDLAGALLVFGAILVPVGALVPPEYQPKIMIPVGLAMAWLGYALFSERREKVSELAPARSTQSSQVA